MGYEKKNGGDMWGWEISGDHLWDRVRTVLTCTAIVMFTFDDFPTCTFDTEMWLLNLPIITILRVLYVREPLAINKIDCP